MPPSVYAGSNYITTSDTFYGVLTGMCVIYVPISCKSIYKSAEGWKRFATIEEIEF